MREKITIQVPASYLVYIRSSEGIKDLRKAPQNAGATGHPPKCYEIGKCSGHA